jgi:hypothetical protein
MNGLLRNWNFMRVFRLLAGLGFGYYAIVYHEYLFLFFAGFMLLQAALNISCCGVAGCSQPNGNGQKDEVYKGQIKKLEL